MPTTVTVESLVMKSVELEPVSREIWEMFVTEAVGASVSKTCSLAATSRLKLPAASWAASAATSTVMVPSSRASGVTASV